MSSNASNINLYPQLSGVDPNILNQYLQPAQTQIPANTIWNTMTPEQRLATQEAPQSALQGNTGSLWGNIQREGKEIGTGLTNLWSQVTSGEFFPKALDYITSTDTAQKAEDFLNLQFSPYKFKVSDIGSRPVGDILLGAVQGAYENPISATLDAVSLGALKPLGKVGDVVNSTLGSKLNTRILPSSTGTKIEHALAGEIQPVKAEMSKLYNSLKSMETGDFENLIKAAEEGIPVPKNLEGDFAKLRKFSKDYDELVKKYSPETYVNPDELAMFQRYARNNNISYEQASRILTPVIESWKSGLIDLNKTAAKNNPISKFILESKKLYDEGKLFPVTHGLAEVNKAVDVVGANRILAGRFTNRIYGNATYSDIAKQLKQPDDFLEVLTSRYVDNYLAKSLLSGKLGGLDLAAKDAKNVKYISSKDLLEGNLRKAIGEAKPEKLLAEDIPIDNTILLELKHQLGDNKSALSGVTRDLYNTGKSALLAQGTYLGANAITGGMNALLNSNAMILSDIISAIKSKGDLAKKLGVYGYDVNNISKTPVLGGIQKANALLGGNVLRKADAALQNSFAELAAQAELRKRGLNTKDIDKLQANNKMQLGEMISDIRKVALLNSSNTILPKGITEAASAFNPFWRWQDTATQATLKMLEKSPTLANTVLVDVLANIGFDQEMQNRLQLGVSLDKPYVTYKFDEKTGEIRQTSAEFVPMTTTLKLIAPDTGTSFSPSIPFFTAMVNALEGKDKYGNLNKRAIKEHGKNVANVMGKRFEYTPEGGYKEVHGMADEVLATAVKELFGGVNLINRTVAPLAGSAVGKIIGQDIHYNQPYAQSIFGDYNDWDDKNNFIMGGSMDRQRTGEQVLRSLSGLYDQKYIPQYEERPDLSRTNMRNFWRQISKQENRR